MSPSFSEGLWLLKRTGHKGRAERKRRRRRRSEQVDDLLQFPVECVQHLEADVRRSEKAKQEQGEEQVEEEVVARTNSHTAE